MTRLQIAAMALCGVTLLVGVGGPIVGGAMVRKRLVDRVEAKIGRPIAFSRLTVRGSTVELTGLSVPGGRPEGPALLEVPLIRVHARLWALLRGATEISEVELFHPRIDVVRGGDDDNISGILAKLRSDKKEESAAPSEKRRPKIDHVRIVDGEIRLTDLDKGAEASVSRFNVDAAWSGTTRVGLEGVEAHNAVSKVAAQQLTLSVELQNGNLLGQPTIEIANGLMQPFRGLTLSGITGAAKPDPSDGNRVAVQVAGSYGGSDKPLWNAVGWLSLLERRGELKVKAARFRLSALESVLNRESTWSVLNAKDAEADANLDVSFTDDKISFGGRFHLAHLTVAHPMLGPVAVPEIGFDARARGHYELSNKRLVLSEAAVDYKNLHAILTADIERAEKRYQGTLNISPVPCQTVLAALPAELTPALQGFKLSGTFSTDFHLGLVFPMENAPAPATKDKNADPNQPNAPLVDLGGKVGIEGCKVVEAPDFVSAKRLLGTFEQTVQNEPGKWYSFIVGPESAEWVPYPEISPHLINSIMTTEDSGFFKHRGFISSEFRSALQQNLQRGYFRLGASSISMQMVKNVLLSREKTLSRKLQEMFLTWYLERSLSKERILEIYFNVIEFGPGIYGIGRATKHYFGKAPKDLLPQEAAWFSSILPSPKRRYIHYCPQNGLLDAKWENYVRRIMRRVHERGRMTDEEYQTAISTPLKFDRAEALPEKECKELVKRLAPPLPGETTKEK